MTGQCERGCAAGRTGTFCDNGTEKDDNKIQRKKINNWKILTNCFAKIEAFQPMIDVVVPYAVSLAWSIAVLICC